MIIRVLLLLLGFFLFSIGQWIAFEIYAIKKLKKINENIANFVYGFYTGESLVKLPNPSENIFLLSTKEGKIITTDNTLTKPLNTENFTFAEYSKNGVRAYVYTKGLTIKEYIATFVEYPFIFGVSLSGLVLFFTGLILLFKIDRQKASVKLEHEDDKRDEELIRSLKALRVSLAFGEMIPRESLQEAKRILEDIIKKLEGKQ